MRIRLVACVGLAVLLLGVSFARSDSPLTSTNLYQAYLDVRAVAKARTAGGMNEEIAAYLRDEKVTLDLKAAVINALGWDFHGRHNAAQFSQLAFHQPLGELKLDQLDAAALFCLGYLQALDDYFQPEKALPYLDQAAAKKPKSHTIAVIRALVRAQTGINDQSAWGRLGRETIAVLDDATLTEDPLRPAAVKIIRDYLALYAN